MKIKFTTGKIKHKFEIPDSDPPASLYWVELPGIVQNELVFKHLKNGQLDTQSALKMAYDFIGSMVVGWEGIHDEDGNEIEFNKDLLGGIPEDLLQAFLDNVINPMVQPMFEGESREDDEIKN